MAPGMRCLEVTLGSTASLKENKASNKVDPYAVLRLGDVECRTDSEGVPGARPVWNHRFNFLLPRDARADPRELHVDVWDASSGADAFLGSCRVAMGRVYQKMSADVTQPVHRPCGKLVGHLRFHFSVLVEDASGGPETPPLPPPPAPLAGWLSAAAASPSPSAARSPPSPLSLPPSASASVITATRKGLSAPAPAPSPLAKGTSEEREEEGGEPVSVSALLQSLNSSRGKGTKRGRSSQSVGDEESEGEEVEEVRGPAADGLKGAAKGGKEGHKVCKPKAQRAISPSASPARSADSPAASPRPTALAPKTLWKPPPPLDLATAFSPTHKAISAVERLMGLSPTSGPQALHKPLAALISEGPTHSPASSGPGGIPGVFPDFYRPLPPLSDLATPAGEGGAMPSAGVPSSMDQFERDCHSNSLGGQDSGLSGGGGPFLCLLKSNSTTSPLRGAGAPSEGAMSRSSSEKQWDVAALAKLTSLFLNSQDQQDAAAGAPERTAPGAPASVPAPGPSRGAPEDWVVGNEAALASALSVALLGKQQAQAGEKESVPALPTPSKRPLGSKSSAFKSTDSPPRGGSPAQGGRVQISAERMLFNLLTSASSEARKRQRVQ